jgi:hypothetical protein
MASCCRKVQQTPNDSFVGIAVLKMINLFVCFSL